MTRLRNNARGSALLAALCFTAVLAMAVTSYMAMCYRSLVTSTRSLQFERSGLLAEIGMEQALWALNKNDFSSWTGAGDTYTRTTSGFTYENGITAQVTVTVTRETDAWSEPGARTVAVTGTTTLGDGTQIERSFETTVEPLPTFVNALAGASQSDKATAQVRFYAGTGATVDSYYSSVSTTPSTFEFGAVVAGNDRVTMQSAKIKGYVAIDSATPALTNATTSAELKGPATPSTTKIDSSRLNGAVNQPFYGVNVPTGAGATISAGTQTLGTEGATEPTLYYADEIQMGSGTITVVGPVKLVVSGTFYLWGSARLTIASTGSLELFGGGAVYSTSSGGFRNDTKVPAKLAIYGYSTSWNAGYISQPASAPFYGVVYLPEATLDLYGTSDYYGSFVAKRINVRNASKIHYDTSLRTAYFDGLASPYGVTERQDTTGTH